MGALRAALFRLWVAYLRLRLRRHGARLVLEAPHGARFDGFPHVKVSDEGAGEGVLTLRLARGVSLGRDTTLEIWARGTNLLAMGEGAYLMAGVRLQLRDGSVTLGPHAHVRDGAVLKTRGELRVGEEVTIGYGDVLACTERIEIGDFAGLGERVTVIDSDHTPDGTAFHYLRRPLITEPVSVGRNVLVSANVVILRGARIGDNAVVGAGAVVNGGDHPAGHVLAGVPARVIKALPGAERPSDRT